MINNIISSLVGSFRRGKSWFANVLHGRHDGFELGGKSGGMYAWSVYVVSSL